MSLPEDRGLQPERTRLAWQRTALAIAIGALVYARIEADTLGWWSWAYGACGAGVGVAIGLWSSRRYRWTWAQLRDQRGSLPDGLLPLVLTIIAVVAAILAIIISVGSRSAAVR